jgi:hypothetical protein
MNQGIAFARTIRALDADDFRGSQLGLAIAVILLGGWAWWILAARVPQYETTTNVRLQPGSAVAYFPPDTMGRIHPDQSAFIRLNGNSFPAQVQSVSSDHAELVFTSHQSPATISTPTTVEIEISRISPGAIAFRSLGRARQTIDHRLGNHQ